MDLFLEVSTPEDLCKHLFLSFVRLPQPANIDGKTLKVKEADSKSWPAEAKKKSLNSFFKGNFLLWLYFGEAGWKEGIQPQEGFLFKSTPISFQAPKIQFSFVPVTLQFCSLPLQRN